MFRSNKNSPYVFIVALTLGVILAVGGSVWATSLGNNVSVTGTLDSTGNTTLSADLTVGSGASIGTGSTGTHFTVLANDSFLVEDQSEFDGISWFDGSLRASSTLLVTGVMTAYGNVTLGDAAGDTFTVTGNSITYSNAGTTTIPSSSAVSWAYATSSANIPFLRFNTSNTRIGISTTSPGATFSVGGAGNIYALGGIGAGVATSTAGALETTGAGLIGGLLNVTGTLSVNSATASSSITRALGVGTTTPAIMFSVGGASGNTTGHGYFTGGVGIGAVSTTTSGALETSGAGLIAGVLNVGGVSQFNGNVIVGDTSADTFTVTSNSVTYSNVATATITTTANSFAYATTSASIPLVKFDATNTRVGISTTTPGATLAVEGDGTVIVGGGATSSLSIFSKGTQRGGCLQVESAEGDGTVFHIIATSAAVVAWNTGPCR